jgi:hypothetical protein
MVARALPAMRSVVCIGFFAQKSSSSWEGFGCGCGIPLASTSMATRRTVRDALKLSMFLVEKRATAAFVEWVLLSRTLSRFWQNSCLEASNGVVFRPLVRVLYLRLFNSIDGVRGIETSR